MKPSAKTRRNICVRMGKARKMTASPAAAAVQRPRRRATCWRVRVPRHVARKKKKENHNAVIFRRILLEKKRNREYYQKAVCSRCHAVIYNSRSAKPFATTTSRHTLIRRLPRTREKEFSVGRSHSLRRRFSFFF